ncbi:MAG: hypothetical protein HQL76_03110 [Magnetococcales bacterium]|nr:hypothetical protein [Magnetococcales bacterium]
MIQSVEAEIGVDGIVVLKEPLFLAERRRAVVTVLEPVEDMAGKSNAKQVLELLDSMEFRGTSSLGPEEIDWIICENRHAWSEWSGYRRNVP